MAWQSPPAGDEEPLQDQHLHKQTYMKPARLYDYETCKATHTNSLRKSASHIVDKKVAKHILSLVFSINMTFYSALAVCDDYLIIKFGK